MLVVNNVSISTSYHQAIAPREDRLTVAIFHGAGKSNSERFMRIGETFLAQGISVLALDFIGHGRTGGDMSEGSLALRTQHALTAIEYWLDEEVPLILVGSSMGAHTALRVSKQLSKRVRSLCLLQPAVYAKDAESVSFTEEFTAILRRPNSWKSSHALEDARAFDGHVYVGIGSEDKVIPWGVIEALTDNFRQNTSAFRLDVLHGAAHTLPEWIPTRPFYATQLIDFLLSGV